MAMLSFEELLDSLNNFGVPVREDHEMQKLIQQIFSTIPKGHTFTRETLARFFETHPESVPIIATCAGLGQEQLKNQLTLHTGTAGWKTLAKTKADYLVQILDDNFDLVNHTNLQLNKDWALSDVVLERHLWSRKQGANSVGKGRTIEDEVEKIAQELSLPYQMRTRFAGLGGSDAPCDMAIPLGGHDAQIVVAMKGFNSTGSKLSDAVKEIQDMARVRLPRQYVFAVIDGIGWLSRKADLKRIYDSWASQSIDGLYSLNYLDTFRDDLKQAAKRVNLLK